MSPGAVRTVFVVALFSAALAMGAVSQRREFGWVEVDSAQGSIALRGLSAIEHVADGWRVELDGGRCVLTWREGKLAEAVPAEVRVLGVGGEWHGVGRFVWDESGEFLAGRIEAGSDGRILRGGLRARVVQ